MDTQDPNLKELHGDNIELKIIRNPGCQVTFEIYVKPAAVLAAHQKAVKSINKEINIPGFRKGKAPEALVLKNYKSYIDREWRDMVVNTAFSEAVNLSALKPLNNQSIKRHQLKSCSVEDGATVSVDFVSMPTVPSINVSEVKLKKVEPEHITQEHLEQALKDFQHYYAKWEEVEDRAVEEGDYIDADIESLDPPTHFICKNTRFFVDKEKMAPWMHTLVIGLRKDEHAEGVSERMSQQNQETDEKKFVPTRCRITIKRILQAQVPPLDDELAKKSGWESMDKLKEDMRKNLENRARDQAREKLSVQLQNALLEKYRFDVPMTLIAYEAQREMDQIFETFKKQNYSKEALEEIKKQIESSISQRVELQLRLFYLTQQYGYENKMQITPEELESELKHQLLSVPMEERFIDQSMPPEELRSRLLTLVTANKALSSLLDQVTIES
jgi:trigger factor